MRAVTKVVKGLNESESSTAPVLHNCAEIEHMDRFLPSFRIPEILAQKVLIVLGPSAARPYFEQSSQPLRSTRAVDPRLTAAFPGSRWVT